MYSLHVVYTIYYSVNRPLAYSIAMPFLLRKKTKRKKDMPNLIFREQNKLIQEKKVLSCFYEALYCTVLTLPYTIVPTVANKIKKEKKTFKKAGFFSAFLLLVAWSLSSEEAAKRTHCWFVGEGRREKAREKDSVAKMFGEKKAISWQWHDNAKATATFALCDNRRRAV